MNKTQNRQVGVTILIAGGIISVSLGAYLLYTKLSTPKVASGKTGGSSSGGNTNTNAVNNAGSGNVVNRQTTTSGSSGSSSSSSGFPLKSGSKGPLVMRLQSALDGHGQSLVLDSDFGPATQAALIAVTGSSTVASESALEAIENSQPSYQGLQTEGTKCIICLGLGGGNISCS